MNWIKDVFKRFIFAALWLAFFSTALWGLYHRDEALAYMESSPPALKQILTSLFVIVLFGAVTYAGWRNLVRRSFGCTACGGSGRVLRINHRYNTKKEESCSACGGSGEVFGLTRRALAFLALGLGPVIMLIVLNIVFEGALSSVLGIR